MKETLEKLESMDKSTTQWDTTFDILVNAVTHHVAEEEDQVFGMLRTRLDEDKLKSMGSLFENLKMTAPTYPHSQAPNTPPGNLVMGPVAAFLDKISDLGKAAINAATNKEG